MQSQNRGVRIFTVLVMLLSAVGLQFVIPPPIAKADVSAGFSEYFIPGAADDIWDVLDDLSDFDGNTFLNVITMPITTPNLTVYYDHWENGYLSGAAGDEVYTNYAVGSVLTFKSPAIPSNPRGATLAACAGSSNPSGVATSNCYDGRDRIFVVGGAVSIAQVFWPPETGTVYANAWEVYPVEPWESSYTIPVGENLYAANSTAYADYNCVYVLVEAKEAGTQVTFDNTRTTAPAADACGVNWWQDGTVTLGKGMTYFRGGVHSGSTIVSSAPVEVQIIVGREDSTYDSRTHTLVPSGQWDKEYYSPVPSHSDSDTNVNIYMYNPTGSTLAVTYQDRTGTVTCNIPAYGTMSVRDVACAGRFVANSSAVYLSAASDFFAIGEYDSGSASRNWGFSIIPKSSLNTEYFLPWAPGNSNVPPSGTNGSPVYVTPTVNDQSFCVDYSPITTPPTCEYTFTRDLLQVRKILDPDIDNTGMHIWSEFPFAMTWGEDANYADTGNPYIDAGYTILPPNPDWIDVILNVNKSANPEVITKMAGETVEFTVAVNTNIIPLDNIFIEDYLPPYFTYNPGTTTIVWPGGTYTTDPTISGAASTGYTLHWGTAPDNIGDLGALETMTLKFKATTVADFSADTSVNHTSGTGYWGIVPLTATAQATVIAGLPGHIVVIKDAVPDDPQDFAFTLINKAKPDDPTNFVLDDDADGTYLNTVNFGLRPGDYSVSETAVANWDLTSATCTSSVVGKSQTPAAIALAVGETVTCTFTNTKRATIQVNKVTVDQNGQVIPAGHIFDFQINGATPSISPFTLKGGQSSTLYYVQPNQALSVSEIYDTGEDGWHLLTDTAKTYCQINSVIVGSLSNNGGTYPSIIYTWSGLNPTPGQSVVCQFTNRASPAAVTLAAFSAAAQSSSVLIEWETAMETSNQGFNLYRSTALDGEKIRLNEALIPSQNPGSTTGYPYSYPDSADLVPGTTYYYWLEDVSLDDVATLHEPVTVIYISPTTVRLVDMRAAGGLPPALPLVGVALLAIGMAALFRRRTA